MVTVSIGMVSRRGCLSRSRFDLLLSGFAAQGIVVALLSRTFAPEILLGGVLPH
jgi:hypothetical protein